MSLEGLGFPPGAAGLATGGYVYGITITRHVNERTARFLVCHNQAMAHAVSPSLPLLITALSLGPCTGVRNYKRAPGCGGGGTVSRISRAVRPHHGGRLSAVRAAATLVGRPRSPCRFPGLAPGEVRLVFTPPPCPSSSLLHHRNLLVAIFFEMHFSSQAIDLAKK